MKSIKISLGVNNERLATRRMGVGISRFFWENDTMHSMVTVIAGSIANDVLHKDIGYMAYNAVRYPKVEDW